MKMMILVSDDAVVGHWSGDPQGLCVYLYDDQEVSWPVVYADGRVRR